MDSQQANQLIEAARRGDKAAGTQLIEHFYERIYAFLRRLAASDADAADLTQGTFSRVWQALPTFAGRSSFSSWIHSIAYHVYVDWRRTNHRTESRPSEWWITCPAADSSPDEAVASSDFAAVLFAECGETSDAKMDLKEAQRQRIEFWEDTFRVDQVEVSYYCEQTIRLYCEHGYRFEMPTKKRIQAILDTLDAHSPTWDIDGTVSFYLTLEASFPELVRKKIDFEALKITKAELNLNS